MRSLGAIRKSRANKVEMGKGYSAEGEGLALGVFPILWLLWLAWSKDLPETLPWLMETGKSCQCFLLPHRGAEGVHMHFAKLCNTS